jgi:L-ascorbate metabolism protein UlaG (beta-lactamase superfamily)
MKNIATSKILTLLIFLQSMYFSASGQTSKIELKYLGAAGWIINQDTLVVLLDPYLSRIKLDPTNADPNDKRKTYVRSDYFESDTVVIDREIKKADYIFIHHSHFDHLSDVPYIAKKTGAKIIGTETTCNILRAYGIKDDQLYEVKGGEDYDFKDISVMVIPSIHSALRFKHYFDSRVYTEVPEAPLKIADFVEGGSFMYLIRFKNHTMLTMGGMNYIEREISGLKPDILLAGVNFSRNEIYKYTERLLTATGYPKIVIPTHWDDFRVPYEVSQKKSVETKVTPFIQEVKATNSKSQVIVPQHLKTIVID